MVKGRLKDGLDRKQMDAVIAAYAALHKECETIFDDGPLGARPTRRPTIFERATFFYRITPELHDLLDEGGREALQRKTRALLYELRTAPQATLEVLACAALVVQPCIGILDDAALRSYNTHLRRATDRSYTVNRNITPDESAPPYDPPQGNAPAFLADCTVSHHPSFRTIREKHTAIRNVDLLGINDLNRGQLEGLQKRVSAASARYLTWLDDTSAPRIIQDLPWITWFAAYNLTSTLHSCVHHQMHAALRPGGPFLARPEARCWQSNYDSDAKL